MKLNSSCFCWSCLINSVECYHCSSDDNDCSMCTIIDIDCCFSVKLSVIILVLMIMGVLCAHSTLIIKLIICGIFYSLNFLLSHHYLICITFVEIWTRCKILVLWSCRCPCKPHDLVGRVEEYKLFMANYILCLYILPFIWWACRLSYSVSNPYFMVQSYLLWIQ